MRRFLFLIYHLLLFQVNYANSVENSAPAYHEISTANISDSFFRIKNAPIKVYEFKYDTTKGRKHVGIIGKDVQRWFSMCSRFPIFSDIFRPFQNVRYFLRFSTCFIMLRYVPIVFDIFETPPWRIS